MSEHLEVVGLGARAGRRVLLGTVSREVARGETLAVVGPNAAGQPPLECVVGLRAPAGATR